jgi:hypothetical protein
MMGLKPLPYQTPQVMLFAKDIIGVDPADANNVFHWDSVHLNLPSSMDYKPSLSWVFKLREDGTPAVDFFFYVNDISTTNNSKREAWMAARWVASICEYLVNILESRTRYGREERHCKHQLPEETGNHARESCAENTKLFQQTALFRSGFRRMMKALIKD